MKTLISFFTGCFLGLGLVLGESWASVNLSDSNNSSLKNFVQDMWGIASETNAQCVTFDMPETACVGSSKCDTTNGRKNGVLLFLARNIVEHGAQFCATHLRPTYTYSDLSWVLPKGNKNICFWVCDDGYGGNRCDEKVPSFVAGDVLRKETYSSLLNMEFNFEESVVADVVYLPYGNFSCDKNKQSSAHYGFWGVTDFTSDGHGVKTKQFIARISRDGESGSKLVPLLEVADTGAKYKVLCLPGYIADGDNCVLASEVAGNDSSSSSGSGSGDDNTGNSVVGPCPGWDGLPGNKMSYKRYYVSEKNCYEYRCFDSSEGFRSSADRACISCYGTSRGVNSNGVCITCSDDMVFDKSQNKCREGIGYTKQDLLYGRNKTVTSASLADQCWTKTLPMDYKLCVIKTSLGNVNVETATAVAFEK